MSEFLTPLPAPVADFSVRSFGAVGDGVANDLAAIQSAIDEAGLTPAGRVVFTPGTYLVSGTLLLDADGVELCGIGDVLIDGDGAGPHLVDVQADSIRIHGLRFVNRGGNAFIRTGAVDVAELTVERCTFGGSGLKGDGIAHSAGAAGTLRRVRIERCKFFDLERAVAIESDDFDGVKVLHCDIDTTDASAITIGQNTFAAQDDMRGIVVHDCLIENVGDPADSVSLKHGVLCYGLGVLINGNIIRNVLGSGPGLLSGIFTKARGCVVSSNELENCGLAEAGSAYIVVKGSQFGVEDSPQGYGTIVQNNHLRNTLATACNGVTVNVDDCRVLGNTFEGFKGDGGDGRCVIGSGLGTDIINNTFLNYDGDAAVLVLATTLIGGAKRIRIEGNTFEELNRTTTGVCTGVTIQATLNSGIENVSVKGNIFRNITAISINAAIAVFLKSTDAANILKDIRIQGNFIRTAHYAVNLNLATSNEAAFQRILIEGNNIDDLSVAAFNGSLLTVVSMRIRMNDWLGTKQFVTENHAKATISGASKTVVVSHGLGRVPIDGQLKLTPLTDMTPAVRFWAHTFTATQFTIETDVNVTNPTDFAWSIEPDRRPF